MYALHLRNGKTITSAMLQHAIGAVTGEMTRVTAGHHLGAIERLEARGMTHANQDFDVLSAALNFLDAVVPEHGLREDKWHYNGDVNLEHGGGFFDLSDWKWGYCNAVRVTDLDSACGFRGAVLIEHVTVNGCDDPKRIRRALESVGGVRSLGARNWKAIGDSSTIKANLRHAIADALMGYGFFDVESSETVQLEPDGPMTFDGRKADKRLHNTTIEQYVKAVHLQD